MTKQIEIVNITHEAFDYYRKFVKGNRFIPAELAKRKLTRNIMLAEYIGKNMYNNRMYRYGQLYIELATDDTVVGLHNFTGENVDLKKDWERYEQLNEILGINEMELQLKRDREQKLSAVAHIKVTEAAIVGFRNLHDYSKDLSDEVIAEKVRSRIAFGVKLEQTERQKKNNVQYYKHKKLLIRVIGNAADIVTLKKAKRDKVKQSA